MLRPAIRRNVKLAEAPSFGKTIFDYEPWCPGANDYRRLAEQFLAGADQAGAEDQAPRAVPGEIATVPQALAEPKPLPPVPGPAVAEPSPSP